MRGQKSAGSTKKSPCTGRCVNSLWRGGSDNRGPPAAFSQPPRDNRRQPTETPPACWLPGADSIAARSNRCGPSWRQVLCHSQSWPYLHYPSAAIIARQLPARDELLERLENHNRRANPKNARAEFGVRTGVIEEDQRLLRTICQGEFVSHDQHNVNIIWIGFLGHIAAENDDAIEATRFHCEIANVH